MVVLNRPEKTREFLLEVTELDRCQLALFAALRRIVLKQLGHSLLGILWQQATHHDSFSAGVSAALPAACITQGVVRQNVARATLQRLLSTWRNAFGLDSRLIGGGRELLPESVDAQKAAPRL